MFTGTKHFDEYWLVARNEFHHDFVKYVDEQRDAVVDET